MKTTKKNKNRRFKLIIYEKVKEFQFSNSIKALGRKKMWQDDFGKDNYHIKLIEIYPKFAKDEKGESNA